jgi:hypothetical protein
MIARQTTALVESHCQALEACADQMSAAGIGLVPLFGHVDRLRRMAYDLRADAAKGIIPDRYTMVGERDMVEVNPTAIQAAMASTEMKGVMHIIRKHSIVVEKVEDVSSFDLKIRARAIPLHERLAMKSAMLRAGLLV